MSIAEKVPKALRKFSEKFQQKKKTEQKDVEEIANVEIKF